MAERKMFTGLRLRKVGAEDFDYQKMEELIEQVFVEGGREPGFKRKVSFAPSSIGYGSGTCARRWYLAFTGDHMDDSADSLGMAAMENGEAYHQRIQDRFKASKGLSVEIERELKTEDPPIKGFIDAIVELDGIKAVGEFKTTREESFVHRKFSGNPMAYHLYQVLIYMYFTEIPQGFLWYSNKNDDTVVTIPVRMNDYTRGIIEDALKWLREVRANWEQDVIGEIPEDLDKPVEVSYDNLPTRPWTKRSKNCKQCPLFQACWEDKPDGNVVIDPMEVVVL